MDYVFIHGGNVSADTWNTEVGRNDYPVGELLGGRVWGQVATLLEKRGHRCFCPTLKDENDYGLADHVVQICQLIKYHELNAVNLVAHSYGGMVMTGVIAELTPQINHAYYVDAAVPNVGQSLFDLLSSAKLVTGSIIEGAPKAYTEPFEYSVKPMARVDKTYIACKQSEFKPLIDIIKEKISHQARWKILQLNTDHLPMATMPDELVNLLINS